MSEPPNNEHGRADQDARRLMNIRIALSAVLFAVTWLVWSGLIQPLILGFGLLSLVLVLVLAGRIGFYEPGLYTLDLSRRLPRFWAHLLVDIFRSNIAVARIVLNPRLPISPCIVTFDASELPPVTQAVLANSITLTPGTLTLDVDDGLIKVHCLTEAFARELTDPEMMRRARRLAGI